MAGVPPAPMMGARRTNGAGTRKAGTRGPEEDRRPVMTAMKLTARYARYLLTSLATVAFGITQN